MLRRLQLSCQQVLQLNHMKFIKLEKQRFPHNIFCKRFTSRANVRTDRKPITTLSDLVGHVREGNHYHLKLLTNICDTADYAQISNEDAKLLLDLCGNSIPDSSRKSKHEVCQKIYNNLVRCNKIDESVYNTYIKVCTENSVLLNSREFFASIGCEPTQEMHKLLLKNACENGDIDQAFEILEIMKSRSLHADEEVFNDLVLVHTITGGIKGAESVLQTMRTSQFPETMNTKLAILRGVSRRNSLNDFRHVLKNYPISLDETQLLNVVTELGLSGTISWLSEMNDLYSFDTGTREFITLLKKKCVHLVYMDKYDSAMIIYQHFVQPSQDNNYGYFLLREMIFCHTETEKIIELAKNLRDNGYNEHILEKLTEVTLRHEFTDLTWKFFDSLGELRPHFFWPLFIKANRDLGERGIFDLIAKMRSMKVTADSKTLEDFVLPFCSLDNIDLLVTRLKNEGFTVRELLSPLLIVLLRLRRVRQAAKLCKSHDIPISGEVVFSMLAPTWYSSKDAQSIVTILQKYCECNKSETDYIGNFLTQTLELCTKEEDYRDYLKLLQVLKETGLKLNAGTADSLRSSVAATRSKYSGKIEEQIGALIDFVMKMASGSSYIPHPNDMNLEELECHLAELEEKHMNTRGMIRRLILQHSSHGNIRRVKELREKFLSSGYKETEGMKSILMHNYITEGHLEPALEIYDEIKSNKLGFEIDMYKIIDMCTLLVKKDRFSKAMEILKSESKPKQVVYTDELSRNCKELLEAFENENQQDEMFRFLVEQQYIKPTNVLLGPLVRIHLVRGDLNKAISTYENCINKYGCTPLQLELLKEVLRCQDETLRHKVVDSTMKVHGVAPTTVTLIAALAENGMEKALKKLFANSNGIPIRKDMEKRCDRWVKEGKVNALQTLVNSCSRVNLQYFDVSYAVKSIMQIYGANNNCEDALKFFEYLKDNDIYDEDVKTQLLKLLQKNKYQVPENLNLAVSSRAM